MPKFRARGNNLNVYSPSPMQPLFETLLNINRAHFRWRFYVAFELVQKARSLKHEREYFVDLFNSVRR